MSCEVLNSQFIIQNSEFRWRFLTASGCAYLFYPFIFIVQIKCSNARKRLYLLGFSPIDLGKILPVLDRIANLTDNSIYPF